MLRKIFGLIGAALVFSPLVVTAQQYTVTPIAGLGGYTTVTGINSVGQATGYSGSGPHAFVTNLVTNVATDFGSESSFSTGSFAYAINSGGQIAGYFVSHTGNIPIQHAFASDPVSHALIDLGALDCAPNTTCQNYSMATAIRDNGQVVGYSGLSSSAAGTHGFFWDPTTRIMTDLSAACGCQSQAFGINGSGQITGWMRVPSGAQHMFITDGNSLTLIDVGDQGPGQNAGRAINASGQVTGDSQGHAALFSNGTVQDLGTLGGGTSSGSAINSTGVIVGTSLLRSGASHAFVYLNGTMVDLNSTIGTASMSYTLNSAQAIDDNGQILVNASTSPFNSPVALLLTPVPPPAGAPVANNDAVALSNRQTIVLPVLANDTTASALDPRSIQIVTPPSNGNATVGYGVVSYQVLIGYSGSDRFTYTVADTNGVRSNVATATIDTTSPVYSYDAVPIDGSVNVEAMATPNQPVQNGGLDGHGYAFVSYDLPGTLRLQQSGFTYPLLEWNKLDAVWGATLKPAYPLPASALNILAVGVNGSQLNQPITVTYGDNSKTTFTQSFSDWGKPQYFAGESIASTFYSRVTPTGAQQTARWYVYSYSLPLDPSRPLAQVTLPHNRDVVVLSMGLVAPPPNATPMPLTGQLNSYGLSNGGASGNAGLDGHGYTYAAPLLSSYLVWSGIPFQIPPVTTGAFSTVSGTVYPPDGHWSTAYLLATGYNGPQPNKALVVTYSDGTKQTLQQSFSDWGANQSYPNESVALTMPYRYRPDGTPQAHTWSLYAYPLALDQTKVPVSIKLPANVKALALTMSP